MRSWDLLDSTVEVAGPADLLAELDVLLASARGRGGARVRVEVAEQVLLDGLPWPGSTDPLQGVLEALNAAVLAACLDVAVHAGVVAGPTGCIAFPAVSGAGKSTLTAACVQAGLAYVSDEALVLTVAGGVRAYARPIGLSAWSRGTLGIARGDGEHEDAEVHVPAGLLGAVSDDPPPLRHVVLVERGPGCRAQQVSRAVTATEVLRRSFNHYRDPRRALAVVAEVVRGATCWQLTHDDPQAAAAWAASLR